MNSSLLDHENQHSNSVTIYNHPLTSEVSSRIQGNRRHIYIYIHTHTHTHIHTHSLQQFGSHKNHGALFGTLLE
jgi:hypothetical protein